MDRRYTNLFPDDDASEKKRKEKRDEIAKEFEEKVKREGGFPFDAGDRKAKAETGGAGKEGGDTRRPDGKGEAADSESRNCDHGDNHLEYCPDCDELVDKEEHDRATVDYFSGELNDIFRRIAFRLLWDTIWSLANPDARTMNVVLNNIVECGVNRSIAEINEEIQEDQRGRFMELFNKAATKAAADFKENYATPLMNQEFLADMKKALKGNLK